MQNIIRLPVVKARTGLSRSTIYQHIANGTFPKQINLGVRAVGWLESDINEWIDSRLEVAKLAKNTDVKDGVS